MIEPLRNAMSRELAADLKTAVETYRETHPYTYEIRGSNQPFCPRQYVYAACQEPGALTIERDDRFFFYCDMGTAVHEAIQRMFAASVEVYCSWTCPNPDCDNILGYDWYTVIPKCPECSYDPETAPEMTYVEYAIRVPEIGMDNMHIDAIIRWKGRVIVIEFKTASKFLRSPSWGYILQANLYTNVIHPDFGASHFCIYYIDRANLKKTLFTYERNDKLFEIQKYMYQTALWGAKEKTLVPGICSARSDIKKYYLDCPFAELCFANPNPPTAGAENLIVYYMGQHEDI